jgi:hypothetical protein
LNTINNNNKHNGYNNSKAYGTSAATEDLKPLNIERRAVGKDDVKIDITCWCVP